jgi:hypothetical protein
MFLTVRKSGAGQRGLSGSNGFFKISLDSRAASPPRGLDCQVKIIRLGDAREIRVFGKKCTLKQTHLQELFIPKLKTLLEKRIYARLFTKLSKEKNILKNNTIE